MTHPTWKRRVGYFPTLGRLAVHHSVDQRVAEVDLLNAGNRLQHGSPDQRRHEIRDMEGGFLFLDELPDGLFGDLFTDAVGDLLCVDKRFRLATVGRQIPINCLGSP